MRIATGLFRGVIDLCFPWTCAVCQAGYEGRGPLCQSCFAELEGLEQEPCCPACAAPLPIHGTPCGYCVGKGKPNFEQVVRLTAYADPARVLVHHLKYHRQWRVGEALADRLLAQERVKALMHETDVLVPVPLHWRRQFLRGYNQAEVIARRLGARCGKTVARALRRLRDTETQTHMHSAARREKNLRDAFRLTDAKRVAGKHVVIVDDVWTTGATMGAVARALKVAKPASMSAIVVAVADPKGVERTGKRGEHAEPQRPTE